jgi:NADH dehydrogenase [ubiquinone] 1 alpha subcomplex assembly factor 1
MNGFGLKAGLGGAIIALALIEVSGEVKQMNNDWYVVNDGVMGGLSQSRAVALDDGALLFAGVVSFENNGGFASIRRSARFFALDGSRGIKLRIKGDGKSYQFRVRTSKRYDGVAYKHDFSTVNGEWRELELTWTDFTATFHGREVPNAPELKADAIDEIGFLIADKQEGPFELRVAHVEKTPSR